MPAKHLNNPCVSILVPTYNRASYIRECLHSLLNQTIPALEIIVIDDGSNDETAEILKQFGNKIIHLRKENGGKPRALNLALPLTRGDYVWLFDDDDVALPDAIEKRLSLLVKRPELGFVFSGHYMGKDGPDGMIERGKLYEVACIPENEIFLSLMKGCYFTLPGILARRSALMTVGEFDPSLITSEDYDIMIRMARLFPCAGIYQPTFIVRQHGGIRGPRGQQYSGSNREVVFRKYDHALGLKIRATLPLGDYLIPRLSGQLEPETVRAALFSRMVVMASKGLIAEMLEDLQTALQTGQQKNRLSPSERQQCVAAICTGYAYDAIVIDWAAFRTGIVKVGNQHGGVDALRSFARGFFRLAKSYPGSLLVRWRRFAAGTATMQLAINRYAE